MVIATLLAWLAAAVVLVAADVPERIPPPFFLVTLSVAGIAAALGIRRFRAWADGVGLRVLLVPHFVRYVGWYLLVLVAAGRLPEVFRAVGWGGLVAAVGASALLLSGAPRRRGDTRWWLLLWSVLGRDPEEAR
jgi:hypothetical protein